VDFNLTQKAHQRRKPEERFCIANTSPTPASTRATEVGSGVATAAKDNVPHPVSSLPPHEIAVPPFPAEPSEPAKFPLVTSTITIFGGGPGAKPNSPQEYMSEGKSPAASVTTSNSPNTVTSIVVGAGNDTSVAVGREAQKPRMAVHVKVGAYNESALAGVAKHRAKTRHNTAPTVLNRVDSEGPPF